MAVAGKYYPSREPKPDPALVSYIDGSESEFDRLRRKHITKIKKEFGSSELKISKPVKFSRWQRFLWWMT